MLTGVILVAAFGLVAVAGLVLAIALYRISGRQVTGDDSNLSQHKDLSRAGPKGN